MSAEPTVRPAKEKKQHIKVFVRIRPFNASEKEKKTVPVLEVKNEKEIIVNENKHTKKFAFDRVFDQATTQVDVYNNVVNPLINEVLAGYNCTVFAYGQTGSGKTYTMEGEKSDDPSLTWNTDPLSGIIPRALSRLFDELRTLQAEHSVRVSYLELYNEELFDLLSPIDDSSKIKIFDDVTKKGGVIIQGLEEVTVDNKYEVYALMEKGSLKRQTAPTLLNAHSSRSHTVFSITVHIKENSVSGDELLKTGKLNLVDLAGSENIDRSGAIDKRAREASNINQSLLTLGRVIMALAERAPHIPYRESKLTRLLQESLGGRTKSSIIATVSPSVCSLEETLSTLDYAHRAKNIQNRPEVNQRLAKKVLIKEYTEEIDRLRRDLLASRDKNGIYIAEKNYNHMLNTIDSLKRENQGLKALSNIKELEKEEMMQELRALRDTKRQLIETKAECDKKAYLVSVHMHSESQLIEQASNLLSVADEASGDAQRLHDKIDRKSHVEQQNSQVTQNFHKTINPKLEYLDHRLKECVKEETNWSLALKQKLEDGYTTASRLRSGEDIASSLHLQKELVQSMGTKTAEQVSAHQNIIQLLTDHSQKLHKMEKNRLQQYFSDVIKLFQELHEENDFNKNAYSELKCTLNKKIKEHDEKLQEIVSSHQVALDNVKSNLEQTVQNQKLQISQLQAASRKKGKQAMAQTIASYLERIQQSLDKDESNEAVMNHESDYAECSHISDNISLSVVSGLQPHLVRVGEVAVLSKAFTRDMLTNINMHVGKSDAHNREAEMLTALQESARRQEEDLLKEHSESLGKTKELSEGINCGLQATKTLEKDLIASLKTSAALNGEQMSVFSSVVHNCGDNLNNHCEYIKDWGNSVSSDVRECGQLVDKYIKELCIDAPTGATPQRKEFQYPKHILKTLPHECLLERFRSSTESTTTLFEPHPLSKCKSASANCLLSPMATVTDNDYSEPNLKGIDNNKGNERNQASGKDARPVTYSASKVALKSKVHTSTAISGNNTMLFIPHPLSKSRSASASDLPSPKATIADKNYSESNLMSISNNKENKRYLTSSKKARHEKHPASNKVRESQIHSGTNVSPTVLGPYNRI